jgi:hypothetical protein
VAQPRQRHREIHGNGGFSDAAFTRSDGDQILDAGNRDFRLFGWSCVGSHQFDLSRELEKAFAYRSRTVAAP